MLKDVVASSAQGALAVWLLSELSLQKALDKKKKSFTQQFIALLS